MSNNNYIGVSLVELREKAGLTQQAFADLLGRNRVVIARWENGSRVPSLSELPAIAAALGVSPATVARKIAGQHDTVH